MRFLIDAYAWVEYFEGSLKGEEVDKILKGDNEIFTLGVTIAEVISRTKRKKQNSEMAFRVITMNSKIIGVNQELANDAGLFHADIKKKLKDFGLIDAIIYTASKKLKAKVVTGDSHFKKLKGVVYLN